jgi:hypothetical protein
MRRSNDRLLFPPEIVPDRIANQASDPGDPPFYRGGIGEPNT